MLTDLEIRMFCLEMAVKVHQGTGIQQHVLPDATIFENHLKTNIASAAGQQITSNSLVNTIVAPNLLPPTFLPPSAITTITLSLNDSLLDTLDSSNFDLVDELQNYLAQFHRVVHHSNGTSTYIDISCSRSSNRGTLKPTIITTRKP